MLVNLLTSSTVEELVLIGEAAKGMAVLTKALDAAVKALEAGKATVAKSAIQAALAALEGAEYAMPEEMDFDLRPLAEMGKDVAAKALKEALASVSTGDLKAALTVLNAVKAQFGKKEEPEETVEAEEEKPDLVEAEFAESASGFTLLEEVDGNPLSMTVEIIQPGWGNKRDNNYYSKDLLKRVAHQFVGAKMYETNHKAKETTNRNWVSTIVGHTGFTDVGAPVYEVMAHAPDFIQRTKNLAKADLIEKLECSIRAKGTTRPGKVGDRSGNIVEDVLNIISVDWVSKAGAGGKAVNIAEVKTEEVKTEEVKTEVVKIVYLAEETVSTILGSATLPKVVKARLSERDYLDQEAVEEAIKAERTYLREASGSGKVKDLGESQSVAQTKTLEEVNARRDAVNEKFLGR